MRRAVEERRGQPRGPQIRRQLAEIHVIVAGDEPLSHVILRSMDVSPRRAATGRSYRVPPLSRTHYPLPGVAGARARRPAREWFAAAGAAVVMMRPRPGRAALLHGLGRGILFDWFK